MAGYLEHADDCLNLKLRLGSQHCQKVRLDCRQRMLSRGYRLGAAPLRMDLDSRKDAIEPMGGVETYNKLHRQPPSSNYDIQQIPRTVRHDQWFAYGDERDHGSEARPGKSAPLLGVRENHSHHRYNDPLGQRSRVWAGAPARLLQHKKARADIVEDVTMPFTSQRLHSYLGHQTLDAYERSGQLAEAAQRNVPYRLT